MAGWYPAVMVDSDTDAWAVQDYLSVFPALWPANNQKGTWWVYVGFRLWRSLEGESVVPLVVNRVLDWFKPGCMYADIGSSPILRTGAEEASH